MVRLEYLVNTSSKQCHSNTSELYENIYFNYKNYTNYQNNLCPLHGQFGEQILLFVVKANSSLPRKNMDVLLLPEDLQFLDDP